jgi:hypothetical protein
VRPIDATAAAQDAAKTVLRELAYNLPVPVRHLDSRRGRRSLHC